MRECGRQRERDLDKERERGTQGCLEKVSNSFDTRHRHMLAQQESQPDTAPTAAKLQTHTLSTQLFGSGKSGKTAASRASSDKTSKP